MRAVIFDTETTGLIKNRKVALHKLPEIIEFYGCYCDLKTGEIIQDYECLIRPQYVSKKETRDVGLVELPEVITKVTGLTANDLTFKEIFSYHWVDICRLFDNADFVIAHNANFDKEMVEIELERLNETFDWPQIICTIEQTMHLKGYRLKLSELYEFLFEEKLKDAHRAKNDVMALKKCCEELYKRDML